MQEFRRGFRAGDNWVGSKQPLLVVERRVLRPAGRAKRRSLHLLLSGHHSQTMFCPTGLSLFAQGYVPV